MAQPPNPAAGGMTQSFTLSLSDAQLDRIVAAMQRQRSLTAEQQAMAEAIGAVGSNMGLATFSPQRPGLVRRGDVVEITPPAGTASVRVYTTRGVEERAIDPSAREGGIPALSLEVDGDYFMVHHTPADTIDRIVPAELAQCAAAVAVMTYVVADLPQRLGE